MSRGYGRVQLAIIWRLAQISGHRACTVDLPFWREDSASAQASLRRALATLKRDGLVDNSEYYQARGRPSIVKLTGKGLELARQRGWA